MYFHDLSALDKATLAVLQTAKFTHIFMAQTLHIQASLRPNPCFAYFPNECPFFCKIWCLCEHSVLACWRLSTWPQSTKTFPAPSCPSQCSRHIALIATVAQRAHKQHSAYCIDAFVLDTANTAISLACSQGPRNFFSCTVANDAPHPMDAPRPQGACKPI
jgi:hypothetical protein